MDKFEEAICEHNPLYKEGLQDKYYQGAKWAWQSRQAELDQLNEAIERQGKLAIQAMNEAHKGSRLELSIAKDIQASLKPELIESERQMNAQLTDENMKLEAELEEKDKRIERATAKWISIVTILTTTDTGVPDAIFKQLDQLHDALCGMNEIGGNNANS